MTKFHKGDEVTLKGDGVIGTVLEVEILEGEPSYQVQWEDETEPSWHWEEDLEGESI